jgi:TPR repeat protein
VAAQINLGRIYRWGLVVTEDRVEAVKWYRKAAEQGNADAQTNLAQMYKEGKGVEKNYEEAVKWYRKAAEQGNVRAQSGLGVMLLYYGLSSREEAEKWLRMAAKRHDKLAMSLIQDIDRNKRDRRSKR